MPHIPCGSALTSHKDWSTIKSASFKEEQENRIIKMFNKKKKVGGIRIKSMKEIN